MDKLFSALTKETSNHLENEFKEFSKQSKNLKRELKRFKVAKTFTSLKFS